MDLEFTEEQTLLAEAVRRFSEAELKPRVAAIEEAGKPSAEIITQLGELGLTATLVPEQHGGAGADTLSFALSLTEIARIHASTAVTLLIHNLAAHLLCSLGSAEQIRDWLPDLLQGNQLATLTSLQDEPSRGAGRGETGARRQDDAYLLEASAASVPSGLSAEVLLVIANLDDGLAESEARLGLFRVPSATPGVSIFPELRPLGLRGLGTADVAFDKCELGRTSLLHSAPAASALRSYLDLLRIGTAAVAQGLIDGAREAAETYAQERRQFGRPIIRFQAIEFMLADMSVEAEASRQLLYQAASMRDQEKGSRVAAARSRLFATDSARRVTGKALQIHGGYGYLRDYPVERYFRDSRSLALLMELPETQRRVIAEPMLIGVGSSEGRAPEKETSGS